MKMKLRKMLCAVFAVALLAGCGDKTPAAEATPTQAPTAAPTEETEPTEAPEADEEPDDEELEAQGFGLKDRSGNDIMVPAEAEKIISMAPSTTRVLIDLGLADRIIAADTNSQGSYGAELADDVVYFDMMAPDQEQIVAMEPDIVFTSGMSSYDGTDAYGSVREAGLCVADIPSSASLQDIALDILFIGQCTGTDDEAQGLVDEMDAALEQLSAIGKTIPEEEKKTVLFELFTPSADYPTIYTAGPGSYINEMLELIGAKNIAADADTDWPALSEEACIAADPQVILTADMYTPDVINVLLTMSGWENVSAIKDKAVYQLDSDQVNQPNHHVIDALIDMARFIYPEYYDESFEELRPAA